MATLFNIGRSGGRARRSPIGGLFAFLALSTVLVGTLAAQADPPVFDGPRLAIEVRERDFGQVNRGTIVEAEFELKNIGSEPLKVLQVKPG